MWLWLSSSSVGIMISADRRACPVVEPLLSQNAFLREDRQSSLDVCSKPGSLADALEAFLFDSVFLNLCSQTRLFVLLTAVLAPAHINWVTSGTPSVDLTFLLWGMLFKMKIRIQVR